MDDMYGQQVTTDSAAALVEINAFTEGFLGNETEAGRIFKAAELDPDCVLANTYSAALSMLMESPKGRERARSYLVRTQPYVASATAREQQITAATKAWVNGSISEAVRIGETLALDYPRELVSAKICQTQHFNLGNAPGMLRVAESVADANHDNPHFYGMLAFGLEQCHLLEDAEVAARQALAMQRKEPWAQHALAHVLLTQGRTDEGIETLADYRDTWTGLSSFMYTHIWWHQCLFLLDRGRVDEVLEIYDAHLWGIDKTYSQDQVGAVSMLLRLELYGASVGDRWTELADYLRARIDDHVQPFLDLHYIYGLARAGCSEADELLSSMQRHATTAAADIRARWSDVAVPAAAGMVAHARGDFAQSMERLSGIAGDLHRIGGSHAQRELFESVLLDARMRNGDLVNAQQQLELLHRRDPLAPQPRRRLAEVYAGLGLPKQAARYVEARDVEARDVEAKKTPP